MKLIDCAERRVLERAAASILDEIIEMTKRQRKALHEQQGVELMRLDKKLEKSFGEKERIFGAIAQHKKEHGC